jgi:putative heme-binding domain-containing protein
MPLRKLIATYAILFCAARAVSGQPAAPVPTPDEEKAQFEVAPGFEVNLFAADPVIDKPIQMNFDPAGQLWLVSSETYPQIKPGEEANDKVIVLEDDGTGHAKAARVFVDGLLIPTGIAWGDGGVYVSNSTELLHFKEGPDGKPSGKRIVLSGFGTEDTHHILHTLRWGPDCRLYFNQSVYIHSHIETPWGVRHLNGGGIWRFEPSSMRLEVFIKGMWNTWGQAWDDYGNSLGTDGAGSEGVNYNFPGAVFPSWAGPEHIFHGLNPGSPKYAGCEIAGGRHLPEDWQGLLLTNDFRASRVVRFQLSDDGAGFAAKLLPDLIKSKTNVFRPVDIKIGPDGAIYIADWCNPIINHGEVDFRDPRRDHSHGRIWRVTASGRALVERPNLVSASIAQLLEYLKSPEPYARSQAKRVLSERGEPEVAPALAAWVAGLDRGDPRYEHHRLEALWLYEGIDHIEPKLLGELLNSKDSGIRSAATRVVAHWHEKLPNGRELLSARIADENPRVRLEAIRALALYPSVESFVLATGALDRPRDRFIDYALYLTATDLKDIWQPAVDSGKLKLAPLKLAFALQAIGSKGALRPLLGELKAGTLTAEDRAATMELITSAAGPEDLAPVFELAVAEGTSAPVRVELFDALTKAARDRKVVAKADLSKLKSLLATSGGEEGVRAATVQFAGAAKVEALRPALLELAGDPATAPATRAAAIRALADLGGKASSDALQALCAPDKPPAVRVLAATALVPINAKTAATTASRVLEGASDVDPTPLINAFLRQKDGDKALAEALMDKKIPADSAKLGLRAIYQASRADSPLLAALTQAGGIDSATPRELTREQMTALVAEVAAKGDAARGESVFRRKELACFQCHAIAGAGGTVAPDLLSIGASAPVDYLIESLLYPNKAVKEGYSSTIVTTNDGDQITGIRVRQDDKELVLKDATHDAISIPLANIKSTRDGGSIMPAGVTDQLTHGELLDLVRFLSELGKGPYAAAIMPPLARRWRVVDPPIVDSSSVTPAALDGSTSITWRSEYAQVNGVLPIPAFQGKGRAVVRAQLQITTPGPVRLKLNDPTGVMIAWFDNKLIDAAAPIDVTAAQGVHSVTLVVEHWQRKEGLRLELLETPGSPAKGQFVGGK